MTYTVPLSPDARDQLIALNAYIADAASPSVADHYTDAIAAFCFSLATFPERGMRRDHIRPGVRVTNYRRRAVVAFAVGTDAQQVTVLGVFYGGQDYETSLSGLVGDETLCASGTFGTHHRKR